MKKISIALFSFVSLFAFAESKEITIKGQAALELFDRFALDVFRLLMRVFDQFALFGWAFESFDCFALDLFRLLMRTLERFALLAEVG